MGDISIKDNFKLRYFVLEIFKSKKFCIEDILTVYAIAYERMFYTI